MAKRKSNDGRRSAPRPVATKSAANVLNQPSGNAATGESSTINASTRKVSTAGVRSVKESQMGSSQLKAKRPRRSAAADSPIHAPPADSSFPAPPTEVPSAALPAQDTTPALVAEVLKQLQLGGFLLKPLTTVADAAEVAPAADAGRVAEKIGADDIAETTLRSLLHGEPHNIQAPEGQKMITLSIPLASQVPMKVKQKIWRDEFIEMAELEPEQGDQKVSVTFSQLDDNSPALAMTSRSRLKPILTFSQWQSAFNIFVAIYTERRPGETPELMKYAETIREIASRFPGEAWRFYDRQFRYARQNSPIMWADIHMELYVKCIYTHGVEQPATFQGNAVETEERRFQPSHNAIQGAQQNASQIKATVCFKFNRGKPCQATTCRHKHAFSACSGSHPRMACPVRSWTRPGFPS